MERLLSALSPRHPRYRSVLRHREGARTILALTGVIVVAFVVMVAFERGRTQRRSGTAPIQIVNTTVQVGSFFEQSPNGTWITYSYVVDGLAYPGYDFRRWINVQAHRPKVCFDPSEPNDHLLVDGRIRCPGAGGR